jgi:iron complex outermembrane receptor protein
MSSVSVNSRAQRKPDARRILALLLCVLLPAATLASADEQSVADIPFEELLKTDIVTADKIARQISDAPSAVSIVTADDIRTYGYRTLSDILDSMRGLFMAHTRYYGFLSGRGYGNAASYSGRITLLIDGYRAPENFWGQSFFGAEALLDVDVIERVEYIPGSGSSSYGDSAFLGVINVVTKKGRDIGGAQVAADIGSYGWRHERVTVGRQFDGGLDLLVSASRHKSDGRTMPEDLVGPGWIDFENDRNHRQMVKASYNGWTFEAADVNRWVPRADYRTSDNSSFGRLKHDGELAPGIKTSVDLYYGRYRYIDEYYDGSYGYAAGGAWRGIDAKLVANRFDRHTLVLGLEYRDDFQQTDEETFGTPEKTTLASSSRRTASVYAYDDIALTDGLNVSVGGRQDARNDRGATFSPRGAIIWFPREGTTLKFSAGQAHRQQTAISEYWAPNPLVERVETRELVWEQMLTRKTRLTASIYRYRIDNYLYKTDGGWDSGDYGPMNTKGMEVEFEHLWNNGLRLRSSYAWQHMTRGDGALLENSPKHIAKLNLSLPLAGDSLRAGLGVRYLGRRLNFQLNDEPAVTVVDLTISGKWRDWSASFSVRNLGNTSYYEVSGALITPQGAYPADRRNYWFQLERDFK